MSIALERRSEDEQSGDSWLVETIRLAGEPAAAVVPREFADVVFADVEFADIHKVLIGETDVMSHGKRKHITMPSKIRGNIGHPAFEYSHGVIIGQGEHRKLVHGIIHAVNQATRASESHCQLVARPRYVSDLAGDIVLRDEGKREIAELNTLHVHATLIAIQILGDSEDVA
eukprot:5203089-Prymnesium_polylepis.1